MTDTPNVSSKQPRADVGVWAAGPGHAGGDAKSLEGFDLPHISHSGSKETTGVGQTRESAPCWALQSG